MRQHQGNGRPRDSAKAKMFGRQVWCIPDLLRNQPNPLGAFLKGAEIRRSIMAGSEFVMGTLAGQQRPRPPYPPALQSVAIRSLAVTVMVVAPPKRAEGRVDLQDSVHDLLLVRMVRVVRAII